MAIASVVLKIINETPSRKDEGCGWGMWCLQYYDPETRKSISVKVVAGEYYLDEETSERRYKAKGMGKKDFDALRGHYPQIEAWMVTPPPIPEPDASGAAPAGPDMEKAPF